MTVTFARKTSVAVVCVVTICVVFWLSSENQDSERPQYSPAQDYLAVLDDVASTKIGLEGVKLKASARRAEVIRDFSHVVSFVGQYRIVVEDVDVDVSLPFMSLNSLRKGLSGIGPNIFVYPANWKIFGEPEYMNMRIRFLYDGNELLSVRADRADMDGDGLMVLHGVQSSVPMFDGRNYLRLELPVVAKVIHTRMVAHFEGGKR